MNINKLIPGVGGGGGQPRSSDKVASEGSAKAQASTSNADSKVNISQQSQSIQKIEAAVAKLPEIDDAAVERIKGALANNEYKIDYERLAGKMIKYDGILN
ncbi:MAG: flagellar biosynthesis anti-sigma factor FlgM [Bermanella sp.]